MALQILEQTLFDDGARLRGWTAPLALCGLFGGAISFEVVLHARDLALGDAEGGGYGGGGFAAEDGVGGGGAGFGA